MLGSTPLRSKPLPAVGESGPIPEGACTASVVFLAALGPALTPEFRVCRDILQHLFDSFPRRVSWPMMSPSSCSKHMKVSGWHSS